MNRLIVLFFSLVACSSQSEKSAPERPAHQVTKVSTSIENITAVRLNYDSLKQVCISERSRLRSRYDRAQNDAIKTEIIQEARSFLFKTLTKDIWPQWYGTEWDFNGISETPGKGQIACGYFVSTTLKHVGFKLNRYRLAQQGATAICKALTPTVKRFSSLEAMEAYVKSQPGNHLYVVGLDYHVGFIQQRDSVYSFTHSSYYEPVAVVDQAFDSSLVLESSNAYVLAPFLDSDELIKSWLTGRQVYP